MERPQDSPVFTPPPGNPRFAATNGLRGLAAIGVLLAHATATTWGNGTRGALAYTLGHGIYVFFVFSGFFLYRPYVLARAERRPAPAVRAFFRRRALRILPAYWFALTLLAIWPGVPGVFGENWWAYYGFLQIYAPEFVGGGLLQAWTLCVDVSFYLALPVYAALVSRIRPRGDWLAVEAAAALALIFVGFAVRGVGATGSVSPVVLTSLPGWLAFFGLGMALAVVSVGMSSGAIGDRVTSRIRRWAWFAVPGAVAFYLVHALGFGVPKDILRWNLPLIGVTATPLGDVARELLREATLFGFALCLVVGPMLGHARGIGHRLLTARWLVWLGVLSYGLYLYHVPLLGEWAHYAGVNQIDFFGHVTLGHVAGALCLSLPLAWLSYRYIELPFLAHKERKPRGQASEIRREPALPERSPA